MERREFEEDDDSRRELESGKRDLVRWRPTEADIAAIQGKRDSPQDSEWVERGIQDVPVATADLSESPVHSADDFHKVPHDVMVEWFRKLEDEVRPSVAKGADSDYFYDLDNERGLDYEHGYRRVYDTFYGIDAIRLEKDGDTCNVVNGYHRLFVAKELGVSTVPASLVERRRR